MSLIMLLRSDRYRSGKRKQSTKVKKTNGKGDRVEGISAFSRDWEEFMQDLL